MRKTTIPAPVFRYGECQACKAPTLVWYGGEEPCLVVCRVCGLAHFVNEEQDVSSTDLKFLDHAGHPLEHVPVRSQVTILNEMGWDDADIAEFFSPEDIAELAVWAALQLPSR